MTETTPLKFRNHLTAPSRGDATEALLNACRSGRLAFVQWVVGHFSITTDDPAEVDGFGACNYHLSAFSLACRLGHLELAKWLAATFGVTAVAGSPGVGEAMSAACYGGQLEVVQWLLAHFNLTSVGCCTGVVYYYDDFDCLSHACLGGHLEIAQLLAARFDLKAPPDGSTFAINNINARAIFGDTCARGHSAVALWLAAHFNLTPHEVEHEAWKALVAASRSGRQGAVRWLKAFLYQTRTDRA